MEFINEKEIFYVSSVDRLSGSSSNFLYKFAFSNNTGNYDTVAVLSAAIPKSYYLISSYNDEFTLSENGTDVVITVTSGNYSLTSWKNTLTTLLNNNSPNGWIYTVTFPSPNSGSSTGKLTFTVSGNSGIQPIFTFSEQLY